MVDLMIIKGNDHLWSAKARAEILDRAYEIYRTKRRKTSLEPAAKTQCPDTISIDSEDSDVINSDDDDSDDISSDDDDQAT